MSGRSGHPNPDQPRFLSQALPCSRPHWPLQTKPSMGTGRRVVWDGGMFSGRKRAELPSHRSEPCSASRSAQLPPGCPLPSSAYPTWASRSSPGIQPSSFLFGDTPRICHGLLPPGPAPAACSSLSSCVVHGESIHLHLGLCTSPGPSREAPNMSEAITGASALGDMAREAWRTHWALPCPTGREGA